MAGSFDVVYLQDSLCVSCNDVQKHGRSFRYSMLYALLAIAEIFLVLHSLWVALLPFALLWWKVMLHALCAKYYAWNRSSRLWLQQTAGRSVYGDNKQELRQVSKASMDEEGETCPYSSQQRGSMDDASQVADIREMSVVSLGQLGACKEAYTLSKKKDVHFSCPERILPHGFDVTVHSFLQQGILHIFNRDGGVAAVCLAELCFQHLKICEVTSHASEAKAVSASTQTRKLLFLCFHEERGLQVPWSAENCHWCMCSSLLRPLVMDAICPCPLITMEDSYLQISLDRNCDMLRCWQYKGPTYIDFVANNRSTLREWVRIFNGSCIPVLNHGKELRNLEWGFKEVLTRQTVSDNCPILQIKLLAIDSNPFNIISADGAARNLKSCIESQHPILGLSGFRIKSSIAYVEDGVSVLDSSEEIDGVQCSSLNCDAECKGTCISTEFTTDSNDGLDYSHVVYGAQCCRDIGCCYYMACCSAKDHGISSIYNTENVCGSFYHSPMDTDDRLSDCPACCNAGNVSSLCGADMDDTSSTDYDADVSVITDFDIDVDVNDSVYGDFDIAHEDEANGSSVEVCASSLHTWWDEDVVLLDLKETEEERAEDEWQLV